MPRLALGGHPPLVDVFTGGQEGYAIYRIPALLSTGGNTLLAFAEGRLTRHDHAENDIVAKRSADDGRTWGPLQVIHQAGSNALNNPTAVMLQNNRRVLLVYQHYAKGFDEHKAAPGFDGPRVCRTFIQHSDDQGATWSSPREITAQIKRPTHVTSTAAGPGVGIQLARGKHQGRILIPFNQGPFGAWKVYAAISDDGGNSWRYGETASEGAAGFANEVQFAELKDGTVMLNARNQGPGEKLRKIARSSDGGETWTTTTLDKTLIDPICQASLIAVPGNGRDTTPILFFANPASQHARTNGVLRWSRDEGKTWSDSRVIYPGSFAYSCLAWMGHGRVGCLFERDGYSKISFTLTALEEMKERP
ncbi:MAG: exo-alpha-sialidase [Verrucomicrobia bacterium]|nr:exo-alpha-sialidase [Verrucomicrobiota bacterium]